MSVCLNCHEWTEVGSFCSDTCHDEYREALAEYREALACCSTCGEYGCIGGYGCPCFKEADNEEIENMVNEPDYFNTDDDRYEECWE
jgi:hypothetical protein